jgi:polyisoprenoid-binding protein YceI
MDRLRRVSITAGTYRLGPSDGTLSVRTRRTGAVAKAGHDLRLEVTAWEATLEVGEDTRLELTADGTSLRVREGTGGMQALGEDDKANIHQTIDEEVLKQERITFQSSQIQGMPGDGGFAVRGDLTLLGATHPFAFDIEMGDGDMLHCVATLKQSDWGIKPYSALFGALKVLDEIEVEIDGHLPPAS